MIRILITHPWTPGKQGLIGHVLKSIEYFVYYSVFRQLRLVLGLNLGKNTMHLVSYLYYMQKSFAETRQLV